MIRLPDPPVRMRFETLLPLIDVVFFLVIAFMMISHLTTARPFDVTLPESAQRLAAEGDFTLFVSAAGEAGFVGVQSLTGEAALQALSQARATHCAQIDCASAPPALRIAADAAAPASVLAALFPRFAAMGFGAVRLIATEG